MGCTGPHWGSPCPLWKCHAYECTHTHKCILHPTGYTSGYLECSLRHPPEPHTSTGCWPSWVSWKAPASSHRGVATTPPRETYRRLGQGPLGSRCPPPAPLPPCVPLPSLSVLSVCLSVHLPVCLGASSFLPWGSVSPVSSLAPSAFLLSAAMCHSRLPTAGSPAV